MSGKASGYSFDECLKSLMDLDNGLYDNAVKEHSIEEAIKIMGDHEAIKGFFESQLIQALFQEYGKAYFDLHPVIITFYAGFLEGKMKAIHT